MALNPQKEGEAGTDKIDEMNFVPDEDVLDDLRKEMGIPEEEIIKNQLDNPNQIEEEGTPKKEKKEIEEESQENPKKDK